MAVKEANVLRLFQRRKPDYFSCQIDKLIRETFELSDQVNADLREQWRVDRLERKIKRHKRLLALRKEANAIGLQC